MERIRSFYFSFFSIKSDYLFYSCYLISEYHFGGVRKGKGGGENNFISGNSLFS